jgi:hypothetical protein
MTPDLPRDLHRLPPHLDITPDFYDQVITKARRRQRTRRAGATAIAGAAIAAIITVTLNATNTSATQQIVPIAPPTTQAPTPTPSPSPTPSPTPTPPAETTPAPPTSPPVAPSTINPSTSPVTAAAYPDLAYYDLPRPTVCPTGSTAAGDGNDTDLCLPDAYLPKDAASCPSSSRLMNGRLICVETSNSNLLVAAKPNQSLRPILLADFVGPSCPTGDLETGLSPTTPAQLLHCIQPVYQLRTGYSCPTGSQPATLRVTLCFTSSKEVVVAPTRDN